MFDSFYWITIAGMLSTLYVDLPAPLAVVVAALFLIVLAAHMAVFGETLVQGACMALDPESLLTVSDPRQCRECLMDQGSRVSVLQDTAFVAAISLTGGGLIAVTVASCVAVRLYFAGRVIAHLDRVLEADG